MTALVVTRWEAGEVMANNFHESNPCSEKPERPSIDELERWLFDGICDALDGCQVEPDGVCPHGYPSWLLYLGYI